MSPLCPRWSTAQGIEVVHSGIGWYRVVVQGGVGWCRVVQGGTSVGMGIGWFGAMLPRRGRLHQYDDLLTRVLRYVVWRHLVDVAFLFVLRVGSCNTGCQSRCASCSCFPWCCVRGTSLRVASSPWLESSVVDTVTCRGKIVTVVVRLS